MQVTQSRKQTVQAFVEQTNDYFWEYVLRETSASRTTDSVLMYMMGAEL